jgi:tetratricopeptide (TPR) repeat protein
MRTETLERSDEVGRISAALDRAAGGAGCLVVVEGPPGIGKTRLVEDARALAKEKGFGRLVATGDEPERTLPWGVVRQLVERSILRYHGETRARILEGPAGAAITALDRALESAGADETSQARTLHALWWVAADLAAERPLLISVDDAQWADPPSLRFLSYLANRMVDLPIALVVGTRPPEEVEGPLADLTAGRAGVRIVPQPLSREALAVLVGRGGTTPAPAVVEALHVASGGNPFLTGQLVDELESLGRGLDDPRTADAVRGLGPRTVSRALLGRLTPDAMGLARAAAILGARTEPAMAADLAELDEPAALAAADALVAGGVLQDAAGQLTFVHPVIREAIVQEMQPGERGQLHAEAARRLHAAGALPGRVAAHLAAAPAFVLPGGAEILRLAAADALAEGDPATAADLLERALDEEPGDAATHATLGLALLDAGRHGRARERLREAARAIDDPIERARLLAAAAYATHALEGPAAAGQELLGELEAFRDDPASSPALVLEERLALASSFSPDEFHRSQRRLRRFEPCRARRRRSGRCSRWSPSARGRSAARRRRCATSPSGAARRRAARRRRRGQHRVGHRHPRRPVVGRHRHRTPRERLRAHDDRAQRVARRRGDDVDRRGDDRLARG